MDVFMLWHIYEQRDGTGIHNEEKLIGVFSSKANAREAIERLKDRDGPDQLGRWIYYDPLEGS